MPLAIEPMDPMQTYLFLRERRLTLERNYQSLLQGDEPTSNHAKHAIQLLTDVDGLLASIHHASKFRVIGLLKRHLPTVRRKFSQLVALIMSHQHVDFFKELLQGYADYLQVISISSPDWLAKKFSKIVLGRDLDLAQAHAKSSANALRQMAIQQRSTWGFFDHRFSCNVRLPGASDQQSSKFNNELHVSFHGVEFYLAKFQVTDTLLSAILNQIDQYFQQVEANDERGTLLRQVGSGITVDRFKELFKGAFTERAYTPEWLLEHNAQYDMGLDNAMAIALAIKIYVEYNWPQSEHTSSNHYHTNKPYC